MFNFEEWSKRLYQTIEQGSNNTTSTSAEEDELQRLWEELFQQRDDMFVQFLDQLLMLTKRNMDSGNESVSSELEKLVDEMRENVLEQKIE